jgi:hypothetical protein
MGQLVNSVATLEKLVNGGAPFNMATKLANGVAPLVNGKNGERSGTMPVSAVVNRQFAG